MMNLDAVKERMKKYKTRQFENQNQTAIDSYLVSGLVAWGEENTGIYHKLILEMGEWFIGRELAKSYPVCKEFKKSHRPKMKQCFTNAQLFVLFHRDAGKYFEGYMCDGNFAVHHAWVVMPDNKVVDFTLEDRDRFEKKQKMPIRTCEHEIAYLGVTVPVDYIMEKAVRELRMHTPIAHMHYLGSNLLFMD